LSVILKLKLIKDAPKPPFLLVYFWVMTTDKQSLSLLNQLHPLIRQRAIAAYNEAVANTPENVHPYIVETYRSFERSNELYAQGRTKPGEIVTNAKAGQSYHNYALALDFGLKINGKVSNKVDWNWRKVAEIFKEHGFQLGLEFTGSLVDPPHVEDKLGHNWRDLLQMYNDKKFIPGTHFLNLG